MRISDWSSDVCSSDLPCGESFWHCALGADGGHGHAQPPFRSSRLIGAERQPTSDCRQSLQQSLEAIIAYRRALAWMPWREDLHIQVGNSFKEFGDYRSSVRAYSAVTSGAHRSAALREMMDAPHRPGSDIRPSNGRAPGRKE